MNPNLREEPMPRIYANFVKLSLVETVWIPMLFFYVDFSYNILFAFVLKQYSFKEGIFKPKPTNNSPRLHKFSCINTIQSAGTGINHYVKFRQFNEIDVDFSGCHNVGSLERNWPPSSCWLKQHDMKSILMSILYMYKSKDIYN